MKCEKWDEQIYLYDDLSESEQKKLNDHLLTCEGCVEKMLIAVRAKKITREATKITPQLENPQLLTQSIMNKINSGVNNNSQSIFSTILDHVLTRYAFAGASLMIVILFAFEQNSNIEPTKLFLRIPKNQVTLNSSSFVKNIKKDQDGKPKTTILSLYSCAKQNGCDNAIVKNFKRRLKS